MYSLRPKYLDSIKLSIKQASSIKAIGEYKGKQDLFKRQTPEILDILKKAAMIESIHSSNRIEGITAPYERIEAIVLKSSLPKNRSEQEISGYRDALDVIHSSYKDMTFTIDAVKQLHEIIYRSLPQRGGIWKELDNAIAEFNPDGKIIRIRFTPVSADQTDSAMIELVSNYKHASEILNVEPLVLIPLTILDFLCIHPFNDGNGRVARLLTTLLLYRAGIDVGRYISLERNFEETKTTYYETLEESSFHWHDGEHNCHPWMNYFWGVLLRAYKEFEERVGSVTGGRGGKTEQIQMAVKRRINPFAISDIESDCPGISREMIRIVLNQLRDDGILILEGKGRAAKYVHKEK
jgi:Fic family protein